MITFCSIFNKCRNCKRNQFSFNYLHQRSLLMLALQITALSDAFVLKDYITTTNAPAFHSVTEAAVTTTIYDDNANSFKLNEIVVPATKEQTKQKSLDDFTALAEKSAISKNVFYNTNEHNTEETNSEESNGSSVENKTAPMKSLKPFSSMDTSLDNNELQRGGEYQHSVTNSQDSFVWKLDPLRDSKLETIENEIAIDSENNSSKDLTITETGADVLKTPKESDYRLSLENKETETSEIQIRTSSTGPSEETQKDSDNDSMATDFLKVANFIVNNIEIDDEIGKEKHSIEKNIDDANLNAEIDINEEEIVKHGEIISSKNRSLSKDPLMELNELESKEGDEEEISTTNQFMETTEQMTAQLHTLPYEKQIEPASDRTEANVIETTEYVNNTDHTQRFEFTTMLDITTLSVLNVVDGTQMTEIPQYQLPSNDDDEVFTITTEESIFKTTIVTTTYATTQHPQIDTDTKSFQLLSIQSNSSKSAASAYSAKVPRVTEYIFDVFRPKTSPAREMGDVLPSRFTLEEHFRIQPLLLLLICSISALFILLSAIIYLINFQRQHGTLDIELHERRCGKDNLEEEYEKRMTLLGVEPVDYPKIETENDECLHKSDKR